MAKSQVLCTILLAVAGLKAGSLQAQDASNIGITEPSIATSFPHNADPYGMRKWLYNNGVSYNFIYTNDVLSNISGGIKRGTIDQGKLEAQLYIDLEKLAGWKNWTFYTNAFGIYNDGRIRRDYVGGMCHLVRPILFEAFLDLFFCQPASTGLEPHKRFLGRTRA